MPDSTGQSKSYAGPKSDSTVQDLNNTHNKLKGLRNPFEPDWYLNVAYFNGDQWVFWNNGRIDRPKLESWRITLVDNRIMPIALTRLARKTKNRPSFAVTPNSFSEEDLNAAELGEKVLEDDWNSLGLSKKLWDALQWAEVCTAGFWKIYWDKTKGDGGTEYVIDPSTNSAFLDQNQRPVQADSEAAQAVLGIEGFRTEAVNMGNVCIDVVSPFNLYPDGFGEDIHECEEIVEENVRSTEYVKKHYNIDVEPDTDLPSGISESRSFPYISAQATSSGSQRGVLVKELYAKSSSKYGAGGKLITWTKNQVLQEVTLDEAPFVGCPYFMFSGIPVPGRFWPTSVTTQLRGPQTELNKSQSQERENAIRFGNPSMAISRHANVQYTGVPGEKIFYDSTVPDAIPSFIVPPEMPAYAQNQIERINQSIAEISGIHEVSKAQVPAGVTAASAINLLLEADETQIGPEIQEMERVLGNCGATILKLRAKFQTDERFIYAAGEDGDWDITSFRNTMLKSTNVEVQAGSAMPKSKAAKQAAMTELLNTMIQYGAEISQRDLRKFLREYGVGGLDSLFAGLSNDEMQVKREHMLMKQGQAFHINSFDDDDFHIEAHNEFRKTRTYWNQPDQIKQIIDLHTQEHIDRRQQAIDAQVAEQKAMMDQAANNGTGVPQTTTA